MTARREAVAPAARDDREARCESSAPAPVDGAALLGAAGLAGNTRGRVLHERLGFRARGTPPVDARTGVGRVRP